MVGVVLCRGSEGAWLVVVLYRGSEGAWLV